MRPRRRLPLGLVSSENQLVGELSRIVIDKMKKKELAKLPGR
jgi:hypothetical protein